MLVLRSRTVLFSPEDRINAPRYEQMRKAKKTVYAHAYAFSLGGFVTLIKAQAARGVKHHWIFDYAQYTGGYNPRMKELVDELVGIKNVTVYLASSSGGSPSHDKFAVIDGKLVQYGSQNLTVDSEKQAGHVILESGTGIARGFMVHWHKIAATAIPLTQPLRAQGVNYLLAHA